MVSWVWVLISIWVGAFLGVCILGFISVSSPKDYDINLLVETLDKVKEERDAALEDMKIVANESACKCCKYDGCCKFPTPRCFEWSGQLIVKED